MKTPAPVRGDGAGAKIEATSNSYRRSSTALRLARQCRPPEAAQARLHAHVERATWLAYLRTLALQQAEPGPITTIIRNSVYTAWARAFLAWAST